MKAWLPSNAGTYVRKDYLLKDLSILLQALSVIAGLSLAILERKVPLPVLGVCLGMQALAHAHGGVIVKGL